MGDERRDLAAEWRAFLASDAANALAAEPQEVRLPSGLSVRVRDVSLFRLFELGKVPDALTAIVFGFVDAAEGKPEDQSREAIRALIEARWSDYVRLIDFVWMQAVVEPRFAETHRQAIETGAIPLARVSIEDRTAVFNYCQGMGAYWQAGDAKEGEPVAGAAVAAFRDGEPDRAVRVGEGLQGVRPGPAGDAGDRPDELAGVAGAADGADAP